MTKIKSNSIILILISLFLLNFSIYRVIEALFPLKKGFSLTQLSTIFIYFEISKWIFEIPTGIMADKYGRKLSCFISVILSIIFLLISLLSSNFYVILFGFFLNGLAYSFLTGSLDALLTDTIIKNNMTSKLDLYNSLERIIFYSSLGLSSLIGGYVAAYSYDWVFIISIFIYFLAFIPFLFIDETIEKEKNKLENDSVVRETCKIFLTNKKVLYFTLIDIAIGYSSIPLNNFYSLFLKNMGINEKYIGLAMCIQFLASSMLGFYILKTFSQFLDKVNLLFLSLGGILFTLLFMLSSNIILSLSSYALGLLIFCIYFSQKYKEVHSEIPNKYRGTAISIISLVFTGIGSVGQLFFKIFVEKFDISTTFTFLILSSLASIIILDVIFFKYIKKGSNN